MKLRTGFVSNSSSSSFILHTRHVTCGQLDTIKTKVRSLSRDSAWHYYSREGLKLEFYCSMDNFDLIEFIINDVGIDEKYIEHKESF